MELEGSCFFVFVRVISWIVFLRLTKGRSTKLHEKAGTYTNKLLASNRIWIRSDFQSKVPRKMIIATVK
jgi:hypothetical protein